jgi:hypothetical protein
MPLKNKGAVEKQGAVEEQGAVENQGTVEEQGVQQLLVVPMRPATHPLGVVASG